MNEHRFVTRVRKSSAAHKVNGIAAVEMAIVLPLVLLLLLPVGEMGRAFVQYSRRAHRVQAAARHVAENAMSGTTGVPTLTPQLLLEAQNVVVFGTPAGVGSPAVPGLAPGAVFVSVDSSGIVRVQLTYAYQPAAGGLLPMLGFGNDIRIDSISLKPQTTLRAL